MEQTLDLMKAFDPKVMIMGKSLFLFPEPVKELAPCCRKRGIHLIYDAAHVLGLVAGDQFQDPLGEGAPIVTGSTHKTFFGSQRGVILTNLDDEEWRKIDKGAFPGSSSNHHLETLVALTFATYEVLEFGVEYARQVVANAKHFARRLYDSGFKVQAEKFGFTETPPGGHRHDGAGRRRGGGPQPEGQRHHREHEPAALRAAGQGASPAGIRLGVQEMTRVGMKEPEMEHIAELFKRCLIEKKFVGDEVKDFRSKYQEVGYSFDQV